MSDSIAHLLVRGERPSSLGEQDLMVKEKGTPEMEAMVERPAWAVALVTWTVRTL